MASEQNMRDDDQDGIDILRLLKEHGRATIIAALAVAAVVGLVAVTYFFFLQPVRRVSSLEFRPTFEGVARNQYPNGLPFQESDIVRGSVIDAVYDANSLADYCDREVFRSGFFVEERSDESSFLDAEYQARLAAPTLTAVERQSIQAEYTSKREALPVQFRLVFVTPKACEGIPGLVVSKIMSDVLATWANQSETKRGVLNHQVEMLTPSIMDVGLSDEGSRLLRADLIRTALERVVRNVQVVNSLPGAHLVRLGSERTTFGEIGNRLVDLMRSRLEPLVVSAGRSMVREASGWVAETLASAEREQQLAEKRAGAYLSALREYSGISEPVPSGRANEPLGNQGSDVMTVSPQVDVAFIERMIQMSEVNAVFRQELTESMVEANIAAATAGQRASYYRQLLQSMRSPTGASLVSPAEVDARLNGIVAEAKALITSFNQLYDEFSRVSLRSGAEMYQTPKPISVEVLRGFTSRKLLMLVFGVFFVTLISAFAFFTGRDRLRNISAR